MPDNLPLPLNLPVLLVFAVCALVIMGCVIERVQYFRSARIDTRLFMKELATVLKTGKTAVALDYCRSSEGAVARIMGQAVLNLDRTRAEVHTSLTTAIELEHVSMERNLGVLATMSAVMPLLGATASLVIMIRVLSAAAGPGGLDGPSVVAGLADALMPAVYGLTLAIISTVSCNYFLRIVRRRRSKLEDAREAWFTIWTRFTKQGRPVTSLPMSKSVRENVPSALLR